ncbi:Phytanoyl-CoA dioxygenase (PhyH) [Thiomonas bhubaneswarensis]|uniref:Phytanoyl-CoA dioxygenase (PhyH) n=2 Tax=Thiomonas bhubaneswarensis TaxID=339866 RepID=A0A0K6IAT4_9BURK|nr:Phytanoyl-CoA dioxygenase (PhyH) [Thiomonas bhubaneswarensis]
MDMTESASPLPTPQDRETWSRQGYLPVEGLFSREELAQAAQLLDGLLAAKAASGSDDWTLQQNGQTVSEEIIFTADREPRLKHSEIFRKCEAYAAALLGMPVEYAFDHVIRKTAGIGQGTRWHQDVYYESDEVYRYKQRVHFWIPMADVPLMGGAMRYIPASHGGRLYEHRKLQGANDSHYVMATGFDEAAAVDVPITAGGAILHHPYLLHASGPNTSPQVRTAWILHFARPRTFSQNLWYQTIQMRNGWRRVKGELKGRLKSLTPAAG